MAWGALIRFPQALLGYYDDEDAVADAARKASFTHREATALDGSEFFARVAYRVSRGDLPRDAIQDVAAASSPFIQKKVAQALAKADEATDPAQPLSKEDFVDDLALTSMAVWKSTSVSGAPDNSSLSHFSTMTWPRWLRRAVRSRHRHAIEQMSRRWRGGQRGDSGRTRRRFDFHTTGYQTAPKKS